MEVLKKILDLVIKLVAALFIAAAFLSVIPVWFVYQAKDSTVFLKNIPEYEDNLKILAVRLLDLSHEYRTQEAMFYLNEISEFLTLNNQIYHFTEQEIELLNGIRTLKVGNDDLSIINCR